jgi:hypothetical protein
MYFKLIITSVTGDILAEELGTSNIFSNDKFVFSFLDLLGKNYFIVGTLFVCTIQLFTGSAELGREAAERETKDETV